MKNIKFLSKFVLYIFIIVSIISSLQACSTITGQQSATNKNHTASQKYLQQGKRNFLAKHYQIAFEQLIVPAEQGNAEAQYAIGYMYYYGKGTKRNQKLGLQWIKRAAQQNYPVAVKSLKLLQ